MNCTAKELNLTQELLESWINGNRSYVREQARKLSRRMVASLTLAISIGDSLEQAKKFVDLL